MSDARGVIIAALHAVLELLWLVPNMKWLGALALLRRACCCAGSDRWCCC